jgi:hypothetical protein
MNSLLWKQGQGLPYSYQQTAYFVNVTLLYGRSNVQAAKKKSVLGAKVSYLTLMHNILFTGQWIDFQLAPVRLTISTHRLQP